MGRFSRCVASIAAIAIAGCGARTSLPGPTTAVASNGAVASTTRGPQIAASSNDKRSITVLYRFTGTPDGAYPAGTPTYANGEFFAATVGGGRSFCSLDTGCGTVYAISPSGKRERVLHQFSHKKNSEYKDGEQPNGGLIDRNGTFYGTTAGGGQGLSGTLFSLSCPARKCRERVLQSFDYDVGRVPNGDLVNDGGTLYGTAQLGGGAGYGTVFAVSGSGQVNAIYSFKGGSDGERPMAGLTDVDGMLYGTTEGQPYEAGSVFKITTSGTETVLHEFGGTEGSGTPDGVQPSGKMTYVGGRLYGTTYWGGAHNLGAVFSISRAGDERVVYSFAGAPDGQHPGGALIGVNGEVYGTTPSGGTHGDGTIFKIDGSGHESVLYNFKGGTDGMAPNALFELNGFLYGTTKAGGNFSDCVAFQVACGTFFRMHP